MKLLICCAVLIFSLLHSLPRADCNIIFVYLGPKIPEYARVAIHQAALFNPEVPIILLANEEALQVFDHDTSPSNFSSIACETIPVSQEHFEFLEHSNLDENFRNGFWKYASERFLVLSDFINQYNLKNVVHLECDVMLYVNLLEILSVFERNYREIGATFDNDDRCIPGFVYFRDAKAAQHLATCFAETAHLGYNDMQILAMYARQSNGGVVKHLPIVMPEYLRKNRLLSLRGLTTKRPALYCMNYQEFDSIFDAAAIGQYLGGIDPRNGVSTPGFINESCLFNPSRMAFIWERDANGRRVPYAIYGNTKARINNLHIHSKELEGFFSGEK